MVFWFACCCSFSYAYAQYYQYKGGIAADSNIYSGYMMIAG